MNRRGLLLGILALGAAPAIVRASSLMVCRPPLPRQFQPGTGWEFNEEVGLVLANPKSVVGLGSKLDEPQLGELLSAEVFRRNNQESVVRLILNHDLNLRRGLSITRSCLKV